jgi:hypothetical protein
LEKNRQVFEKDNESVKYKYSLDDKDASGSSYSISAISCCRVSGDSHLRIASGSSQGVKVWSLSSDESDKSPAHTVSVLKMSSSARMVTHHDNDDDEDDEVEEVKKEEGSKKKLVNSKEQSSSSRCNIQ